MGAALTTAVGTSGQQFCSNAFGVLTMRVAASLENTSTYVLEVFLLQVMEFNGADLFILMNLTVNGAAYAISAMEVTKAALKAETDFIQKVTSMTSTAFEKMGVSPKIRLSQTAQTSLNEAHGNVLLGRLGAGATDSKPRN